MATENQRKVAELIVENTLLDIPLNGGEMLEKVGYSEGIQKSPSRVLQSEGVKEHLKVLGFDEDNAKHVVVEIMLNPAIEPNARLKATDQVFKVQGSYAAEKSINLNMNANIADPKSLEIAKKYEEELKSKL